MTSSSATAPRAPRRAASRGGMKTEAILAFAFGVTFVVTLLVLAIAFPNPSPFQYAVFRVVLALACAGVAVVIPGILNLTLGKWLTAGGALAVFAVVYFFSPAAAVATPPKAPVGLVVTPSGASGCPVAGGTAVIEVGGRSYQAALSGQCAADFFDLPAAELGKSARLSLVAKSGGQDWVVEQNSCALPLSAEMRITAVLADATPRTMISLLAYDATNGDQTRNAFGEFKAILNDRIVNTVEALKAAHKGLGYLDALRLCECGDAHAAGNAALMDFWTRTHSLQLWGGVLVLKGEQFAVQSRVFSGSLAERTMPVEMDVAADEFADIRDNHSLVILYALSRDARRLHMPDDVVALYLSKTREIATDLRSRNRSIPAEIEQALQ